MGLTTAVLGSASWVLLRLAAGPQVGFRWTDRWLVLLLPTGATDHAPATKHTHVPAAQASTRFSSTPQCCFTLGATFLLPTVPNSCLLCSGACLLCPWIRVWAMHAVLSILMRAVFRVDAWDFCRMSQ